MFDDKSTDQASPESKRERFIWRWRLSELLLLGGIVLLGVLILTIHLLTWGKSLWLEARRCDETRCTVMKLYRHSRRDNAGGLFYRPEILIEYEAAGTLRRRLAYDRTTLTEDQGFVYTMSEADAILLRYKIGGRYRCRYSVDDPDAVVLEQDGRSFWGWWFLLIPGTLIVFGTGGLIWRGIGRLASKEKLNVVQRRTTLYPTVPETLRINDSPGTQLSYRLPLAFFPVLQTVIGLLLAILWNVVAWFVFLYILSIREDSADVVLAVLFGLIFCGTGLLFFPWFVRRFKAAFGIGPTLLEISNHPIFPGRNYRLALMQSGRLNASAYRVFVLCHEIARYRQGTDTLTNQKEVFRQSLFVKNDWTVPVGETASEEFFLKLPIGAMHSFAAENNRVLWRIVIDIEVKPGLTLRRECPLVVMPFSPSEAVVS